ncbi:MAG: transporter [Elusimicrobiales bacterium]|nr:transporter [Elusimicrobiales bacterium]
MRILLAALILAVCGGNVSAFHPLIGEDTGFLGKDVRQLEAGLEYSAAKEGPDTYATGAAAELSYGLFEDFDVLITVPWQGWRSHGISESGLGDVLLEVKFPVDRRAGWTFALKPGFSLPAGDEAKSLGAGKGGAWLYGIAGRAAGPWQYYLNAGYMLNRNSFDEEENILKASASAAYEFLPKVLATGELAAETNPDKEAASHPVYSVLGLVWSPYPTLDLDLGVRLGLTRPADDLGLLAGFTLRL